MAYYDMYKNSHEIFKVANHDVFLRIYKNGNFKRY